MSLSRRRLGQSGIHLSLTAEARNSLHESARGNPRRQYFEFQSFSTIFPFIKLSYQEPHQSIKITMVNLRREIRNTEKLQEELGETRSRNVPAIVKHRGGKGASWRLTDTMKLALILQAAEEFDRNDEVASRYLRLNNREIEDLRPLLLSEKAREAQYEADVNNYNIILFTIAEHCPSNTLTTEQRRQLEEAEEASKRYLRGNAPEGYLVKKEDVEATKAFVRGRGGDSQNRQAIFRGLDSHIGKDYGRETIGAFFFPKGDSEDDEEDTSFRLRGGTMS